MVKVLWTFGVQGSRFGVETVSFYKLLHIDLTMKTV